MEVDAYVASRKQGEDEDADDDMATAAVRRLALIHFVGVGSEAGMNPTVLLLRLRENCYS